MNKNKIISIILLFLVIILTLGIGLFFSYKSIKIVEGASFTQTLLDKIHKSAPVAGAPVAAVPVADGLGKTTPAVNPTVKNIPIAEPTQPKVYYEINETQQNIFSKNPQQYELDLNILNDQLQNIYLFMILFYANEKNHNIYTDLLSQTNSAWYIPFQSYGLLGNTENIDITQLLNPNCFFYYNTTNENINPSTIYYNIQNATYFIKFINNLNSALTTHSTNQLNYGTISSDYNLSTIHPYTELVEIMYVMTFVPTALYNIYIMPFNEIIVKFNGAIDTYEDYMQFQQLYSCANQMNLSKKNLSDSNGNILTSINCIHPTENQIVQNFVQQILPIFSNSNYTSLLEPSYIMFYESMLYFAQKFGFIPSYNDTYNYTDTIQINIPTKKNISTSHPTYLPTTLPVISTANGTFDGTNSGNYYSTRFNKMNIKTIKSNDNNITKVNGGFKFMNPGNYTLIIKFSQWHTNPKTNSGNGYPSNINININLNTTNQYISSVSASGISDGNGNAPSVTNNIANFPGKFANSGSAYSNMFEYICVFTVTDINETFNIYVNSSYDTLIGNPFYDPNYSTTNNGDPIFSITKSD